MNRQETLAALRMVAAYQPGQKTDAEFTEEAWADAFHHHEFLDVRDAIKKLGTEPRRDGSPFYFELRDVLTETHNIVAKRLEARQVNAPGPPSGLNAGEYRQWLADTARAMTVRDWTPPRREIEHPQRPIASLVKALAGIRSGSHHPEPKDQS